MSMSEDYDYLMDDDDIEAYRQAHKKTKRIVKDRHQPLGFGKHREMSLHEIRHHEPGYFAWLHRARFLAVEDKKDRKWFSTTGSKLNARERAWWAAMSPFVDDFDPSSGYEALR